MSPVKEEWRPVGGWPYSVSSLGRVKRTKAARGATKEMILSRRVASNGYPTANLRNRSRQWQITVHRLVAFAFLGPPPTPKHEINHKNGIKTDSRVGNLEWVTRSQNCLHAFRTGLQMPVRNNGELSGSAKLTEVDVAAIRKRYGHGGITQYDLAAEYGVSQGQISYIVNGRCWTHTFDQDERTY